MSSAIARKSEELFRLCEVETRTPSLARRNFLQVAGLIRTCPELLHMRNQIGQLPIHVAALHQTSSSALTPSSQELVSFLAETSPRTIQETDKWGRLPLHNACKANNVQVVEFLVRKWPQGALHENADGELPLHVACRRHSTSLDILQCLVQAAPETIRVKDKWDMLPLHYACFHTDQAAVVDFLIQAWPQALLQKSSFYGGVPLHAASRRHDISLPVIRSLVAGAPESVRIKNDAGWLPVDRACCEKHHQYHHHDDNDKSTCNYKDDSLSSTSRRALLEALAGPGKAPLHFACEHSSFLETLRYIAELYPEDARRMVDGKLPLHLACGDGGAAAAGRHRGACTNSSSNYTSLLTIRFLVGLFPDAVRIPNSNGDLALHCACRSNANPAVLEFLIEQYPEALRTTNFHGDLPLHCLCSNEAVAPFVLEFLVEQAEETVKCTNQAGNLPLHVACNNMSVWAVDYLTQQHPSAVQVKNKDGCFPLHLACCRQHVELSLLKYLVRLFPAALSCESEKGYLPLHYALSREHQASLAAVCYLVQEYPSSFWQPVKGWLPVQMASLHNASLDVVHHLVQRNPESILPF